jgi:hypothetical protein
VLPILIAAAVGAAGVFALSRAGKVAPPPPPGDTAHTGGLGTPLAGEAGNGTKKSDPGNEHTAPPRKDDVLGAARKTQEAIGYAKEGVGVLTLDAASFLQLGIQAGSFVANDIAQTQEGKTAAQVAGATQGALMAVICGALAYSGAASGVAYSTLGPIGLAVCVAIIDITIIVAEAVDTIGGAVEEAKEPERRAFVEKLIAEGRLREAAAFGVMYYPGAACNFRLSPPRWGDADTVVISDGPHAGETFSADAMLKFAAQPCWDAWTADTRDHYNNPTGRKHRDAAREDFERFELWCKYLGGSPWPDGNGSTYWGGWAPWNAWDDLVQMYGPPNEPAHSARVAGGGTQAVKDARAAAVAATAKGGKLPGVAKSATRPAQQAVVLNLPMNTPSSTDPSATASSAGSMKPTSDNTKRTDA